MAKPSKDAMLPLLAADHPAVAAVMKKADLFDGALICIQACALKPNGRSYYTHYQPGEVVQPSDPNYNDVKKSPLFQVWQAPAAPPAPKPTATIAVSAPTAPAAKPTKA